MNMPQFLDANGLNKYHQEAVANKVDKVKGKSLIDDSEIARLADIHNYDDTQLKADLESKVDKVEGKELSTNDFTNEYRNKLDNLKEEIDIIIKPGTGEGAVVIASDRQSTAEGKYSLSQGYYIKTFGEYSHAEGKGTTARGKYSHAEGTGTTASGYSAHSEGDGTIAEGYCSHAQGYETSSSGAYSFSSGRNTKAEGDYSHAEGYDTQSIGTDSHSEGYSTKAVGAQSHSEGVGTIANGTYSHAEGGNTTAEGYSAHSEGRETIARANFSHAEGLGSLTNSIYSHAEGTHGRAYAISSHAEGRYNMAQGEGSHAEGNQNTVYSDYSHAEGQLNIAGGEVYGKTATAKIIEKVANKDRIKVTLNENNYLYSTLYNSVIISNANNTKYICKIYGIDGNTITLANKLLRDNDDFKVDSDIYIDTIYVGEPDLSNINTVTAISDDGLVLTLGEKFKSSQAAELIISKDNIHYFIAHTISIDHTNNIITLDRAIPQEFISTDLLVYQPVVEEHGSHVEGYGSRTIGYAAHAEGIGTIAIGEDSHAEGNGSKAIGPHSHAQGKNTESGGEGSFTSGIGTKTCRDGQTAIGYYNETYGEDSSRQPLFAVGNGSDDANRSSAFEVFANGITVLGANPEEEMHAATKKYVDTAITNRFSYLWQGKSWLVVGDDTTWRWGKSLTNGTETTYYAEQNEHYFNLIKSKTGITATQNGVTDTGFLGDVSTDISDDVSYNKSMLRTGCFIDRIRRMNSVAGTAIHLVDYDVITIFGGALSDCKLLASGEVEVGEASHDIYNLEPYDSQTLCGRINTTINAILLKNPTIQIALVTPIPRDMDEETKAIWDSYVDAIIEVCHVRGIPCLDIYHNSALQPNFEKEQGVKNLYSSDDAETDYIHLNATGHKFIAPRFKAMLDTLIL